MSRFRPEPSPSLHASIELDRLAVVRLGSDRQILEQASVAVRLDPEQPEKSFKGLTRLLGNASWRGGVPLSWSSTRSTTGTPIVPIVSA